DQLEWLERDLAALSPSTPVVVYSHVPLWAVYPEWGWVTEGGEQALTVLLRFASVTVRHGHLNQVMPKWVWPIAVPGARQMTYQRFSSSSVMRAFGSSGGGTVSARTSVGRSSGRIIADEDRATARSMTCCSSRTLPGHG